MKNTVAITFLVLLVYSCTERIDVKLDEQEYARIVVEGNISTDTTAHIVKLTKTADYFVNEPAEPVSGALVTISSDADFFELTETPENSGIYLTAPDVYGKVGSEYRLRIVLDEEIGGAKEFEAISKIYPINEVDSIDLKFYEYWGEDGFYEVQCFVWDPPTEDFYMFETYINGRLVTDSISKVFVVDDLLYNGNYTNGIGVGYFDQSLSYEKIVPGDTVKLKISRLTKDHSEFIFRVQEEISYQSPLFSGPPANVNGNISNGGFGFFGAYSASYSTTVLENPSKQ
ncbi:MAG: DUF4249 domain-containing protein [Bacteroidales bacterium]|nr:DUF4249 domain-containing protein [Bacteroidales bacterium]